MPAETPAEALEEMRSGILEAFGMHHEEDDVLTQEQIDAVTKMEMTRLQALRACWLALQLAATLMTIALVALAIGTLIWTIGWLF